MPRGIHFFKLLYFQHIKPGIILLNLQANIKFTSVKTLVVHLLECFINWHKLKMLLAYGQLTCKVIQLSYILIIFLNGI